MLVTPRYAPWLLLALCAALAIWVAAQPPQSLGHGRHALVSPLGSGAPDRVMGDFNGDGHPDLAIAEGHDYRVDYLKEQVDSSAFSIWLGDGTGHLRRHAIVFGLHADRAAVLDADGDGDVDLVAADSDNFQATLLLNDGRANFRLGEHFSMLMPTNIVVGDLDNDGHPDLVAPGLGCAIGVWHNDGKGHFRERNVAMNRSTHLDSLYGRQTDRPWWVALADVDRDGDLDVLAVFQEQTLSLLLNDGHGQLPHEVRFPLHTSYIIPGSLAIGDVDGDGWPDLALVLNDNERCASWANTVRVLLNDGHGRYAAFSTPQDTASGETARNPPSLSRKVDMSYRLPGHPSIGQVAFGDVDQDGDLDLVATGPDMSCVQVRRNDGFAHFAPPYVLPDRGYGQLALGDFNGDGRLEWLTPQAITPLTGPPAPGDRAVLRPLW
jgi:hypothetical protein